MMYYVTTHTRIGANSLQKKLVEAAEEWNGTLVGGDEARKKCIENFKLLVSCYNEEFSKCKPCQLALFGRGFMLYAEDKKRDHTFAIVFFNKVQSHYDGITHWRI
ncbi:MAG: hypothetical protein IKJ56_03775 [Bacteroidales bacterium]|nr:hypothetical protein [Bacteroidales bacterium]